MGRDHSKLDMLGAACALVKVLLADKTNELSEKHSTKLAGDVDRARRHIDALGPAAPASVSCGRPVLPRRDLARLETARYGIDSENRIHAGIPERQRSSRAASRDSLADGAAVD